MSEILIKARSRSEHEDSEYEIEEKTTLVHTDTINISVDSFCLDQNGNEIEVDLTLGVQKF